jgi:hypothetical protein
LKPREIKDRLSGAGLFGLVGAIFGWTSGIVGTVVGAMAGWWLFLGFGAIFGLFAGPDIRRRLWPWFFEKISKFRSVGRKHLHADP